MYTEENDDFMAKLFETPEPVVTPNVFDTSDETDDVVPPVPPKEEEVPTPPTENDSPIWKYVEFAKANDLLEMPEDYDFQGTPEQLEEIQNYTKKQKDIKAVEGIFEALPEQFKPLFDYALRGGTSIQEYYNTFVADPLDTIDLESVADQKKIIKEHYRKNTKFSDEQIDRRISLISDEEDLKSEALEAFNDLKALRQEEQVKLLEETATQAQAAKLAAEQRTLELSKAIDSTTLVHPQRKNKVKTFFFEPINVEGQVTTGFNHTIQSILSRPEHQAQLADILLEYDPTLGFSQERLEKKVKTKASQQFQKLVEDVLETKQSKKVTANAPNTGSFDWATFNEHQ